MTREFFERQMARMFGLRFPPMDLETHWEGLHGLPDDILEAAVTRAVKVRIDFPVPQELREDADIVASSLPREPDEDRAVPLAEPFTITVPQAGTVHAVTREWRYYDERCSDTGWASWWCGPEDHRERKPWWPAQRCDRRGSHAPHEWVGPCACAESNPALVKRRERQQKYAEAKPTRAA